MALVEGRTFLGLTDRAGECRVEGAEFRRCTFRDCLVSAEDVQSRPTVRNTLFADCEEHSCSVSDIVIEDVTIDGLKVKDLLIIADCAFKHVTLRGKLGSLKITRGHSVLVKKRPKLWLVPAASFPVNSQVFRPIATRLSARPAAGLWMLRTYASCSRVPGPGLWLPRRSIGRVRRACAGGCAAGSGGGGSRPHLNGGAAAAE